MGQNYAGCRTPFYFAQGGLCAVFEEWVTVNLNSGAFGLSSNKVCKYEMLKQCNPFGMRSRFPAFENRKASLVVYAGKGWASLTDVPTAHPARGRLAYVRTGDELGTLAVQFWRPHSR